MNYQYRGRLYGKILPCLQPNRVGENLVLLGDCFPLYGSRYEDSIKLRNYVSQNWSKVYVVPGLVEICGNGLRSWMRNIDQLHEVMEQVPKKNISVLNNSEIHDGDHMLVGSTLWSGAGPAANIIKAHPQLVMKDIDQWAADDAEFIGAMVKNATIMKKTIAVATYFPHSGLTMDAFKIFEKHIGNLDMSGVKGCWVSGCDQSGLSA